MKIAKRFTKDFFSGNRSRLCEAIPDGVIFIPAHFSLQYSADMAYPFRQDSNFWYFSGISEPDLILAIDSKTHSTILFIPSLNKYQTEWEGEKNDIYYKNHSTIESIVTMNTFNDYVLEVIKNNRNIYSPLPYKNRVEPYGFIANPARKALYTKLKRLGAQPKDIREHCARLRQIKQPQEITAIREAIDITGITLKNLRINDHKDEKSIEQEITSSFYRLGSDGHAYTPIVASGANAATIHYNENNSKLPLSGLILLDIGAYKDYYCADISRTYAIGMPTRRQKDLLAAVLDIQNKAMSILKEGVLISEYQKQMEEYSSNLFKKLNCSTAFEPFPHGFSHFLGLDVHDSGIYNEPLAIDSVLTVEPGLYLADEGIGIRIEDNVRITSSGVENLSSSIPREMVY